MKIEMTAVIARADVPNKNGHVYTTEALQAAIDKFNGKPVLGIVGMAGAPNGAVDLTTASHMVQNLRIENGEMLGDVVTLDTDQGQILADTLQAVEGKMDFRTAGTGMVHVREDGTKEIRDFTIGSINAVFDGA